MKKDIYFILHIKFTLNRSHVYHSYDADIYINYMKCLEERFSWLWSRQKFLGRMKNQKFQENIIYKIYQKFKTSAFWKHMVKNNNNNKKAKSNDERVYNT